MSFKSKMLAGAATLALVGGVAMVGALSASAATPSCGHSCINVFSRAVRHAPLARTSSWTCSARARRSASRSSCSASSNSDPAEDFTVSFQGTVSDFYAAGLVSSAVNLHYGNGSTSAAVDEPAFEVEYAPYGVDSGLCVGTGLHRVPGRGRHAPAVRRVRQDRLDPGQP